jgi:hypothetical protein
MSQPKLASDKSVRYLDILLNDNGFDTHVARMGFVHKRILREVHGTSELYQIEANNLIDELVELKERKGNKNPYHL